MIVNEVVTKFSYKGSSKELEKFNVGLKNTVKGLKVLAIGFSALSVGVTAFATKISKSLDPLIQLSRTTGDSIAKIQELGYVASVSGSSMEAVQSSVKGLSKVIGDAAQNGSADFDQLGISVRKSNGQIKSATEIMAELPKAFKSLSKQQQISFASRLGIDPSLVQMLRLTNGQLTKLQQKALKLGVITKAQGKSLAGYNDSLTTLKFAFKGVSESITVALIPQFEKLTKSTINLISNNKKLITQFIVNLSNAIAGFVKAISNILTAMGNWKYLIIGIGVAIKIALSPMLRMITIITAVVLIVDDLISAFHGAKSVIGGSAGLAPQLAELGVLLGAGFVAFKALAVGVGLLKDAMMVLDAVIVANPIGILITSFVAVGVAVFTFRKQIWSAFKDVGSFLDKWLVKPIENFFDKFIKGFSFIKKAFSFFSRKKVSVGVQHTNDGISRSHLGGNTALHKVISSSINNSNSNSNTKTDNRSIVNNTKIDMKIDGASPDTIDNIKHVTQNRQNQDASNNFNRGFGSQGAFV